MTYRMGSIKTLASSVNNFCMICFGSGCSPGDIANVSVDVATTNMPNISFVINFTFSSSP